MRARDDSSQDILVLEENEDDRLFLLDFMEDESFLTKAAASVEEAHGLAQTFSFKLLLMTKRALNQESLGQLRDLKKQLGKCRTIVILSTREPEEIDQAFDFLEITAKLRFHRDKLLFATERVVGRKSAARQVTDCFVIWSLDGAANVVWKLLDAFEPIAPLAKFCLSGEHLPEKQRKELTRRGHQWVRRMRLQKGRNFLGLQNQSQADLKVPDWVQKSILKRRASDTTYWETTVDPDSSKFWFHGPEYRAEFVEFSRAGSLLSPEEHASLTVIHDEKWIGCDSERIYKLLDQVLIGNRFVRIWERRTEAFTLREIMGALLAVPDYAKVVAYEIVAIAKEVLEYKVLFPFEGFNFFLVGVDKLHLAKRPIHRLDNRHLTYYEEESDKPEEALHSALHERRKLLLARQIGGIKAFDLDAQDLLGNTIYGLLCRGRLPWFLHRGGSSYDFKYFKDTERRSYLGLTWTEHRNVENQAPFFVGTEETRQILLRMMGLSQTKPFANYKEAVNSLLSALEKQRQQTWLW